MWSCNVNTIEREGEKCKSSVLRKERLVYPRSLTLLRWSYFVWHKLRGDRADGKYEIPHVVWSTAILAYLPVLPFPIIISSCTKYEA